jgi:hypothetical protein
LVVTRFAVALSIAFVGLQNPALAGCPRFVAMSDGLPNETEWRTHPAIADVNGDGYLDLAGLPRKGRGAGVWLGGPGGKWASASTGLLIPGFTCGVGVDFADVNADGHPDLGVADHCQGLFIFHGDGRGGWRVMGGPAIDRDRAGYEDLQFGDMNRDANQDLLAVGSSRGGITTFLGDGRGGWTQAKIGLPESGYGTDLKLGDINGDGYLDVAAAFVADDPGLKGPGERKLPVVWVSDGTGRLHPASAGLPDEGDFRAVALGDVNGDGMIDLAISAGVWPGRPPLLVYLGNGGQDWNASPGGHPASPPGMVFEGVEIADLDRDGKLDLVAVSHHDAGIHVWRGDGKGAWEACADTGLPGGRSELRGWGLAVADLNRDGRLDIAAGFGRNSAGSLEVWVQR